MGFLMDALYKQGYRDGLRNRAFNLKYIYSAEYSRGYDAGLAKFMR